MNILNSASKIVFIVLSFGALALTAMRIMDVKDFGMLVGMAFSFYFSNKGDTSGTPFVGK